MNLRLCFGGLLVLLFACGDDSAPGGDGAGSKGAQLVVFSGVAGQCAQGSGSPLWATLKMSINGDPFENPFGEEIGTFAHARVSAGATTLAFEHNWLGCNQAFHEETLDLAPGSVYAVLVGGRGPHVSEAVGVQDVTSTFAGENLQVLLANTSDSQGVTFTMPGSATGTSVPSLGAVGVTVAPGGGEVSVLASDGTRVTGNLGLRENTADSEFVNVCFYRELDAGPEVQCSWTGV